MAKGLTLLKNLNEPMQSLKGWLEWAVRDMFEVSIGLLIMAALLMLYYWTKR